MQIKARYNYLIYLFKNVFSSLLFSCYFIIGCTNKLFYFTTFIHVMNQTIDIGFQPFSSFFVIFRRLLIFFRTNKNVSMIDVNFICDCCNKHKITKDRHSSRPYQYSIVGTNSQLHIVGYCCCIGLLNTIVGYHSRIL